MKFSNVLLIELLYGRPLIGCQHCFHNTFGYCQNLWEYSFLQKKMVSYLFTDECRGKLQQLLKRTVSTLVVTLDTPSTNAFEEILISTPTELLIHNSFLFVFNRLNYSTNFISNMFKYSDGIGKISLNSQLFILTKTDKISKLFEGYKPCATQAPVHRQLMEFSRDKITWVNNKYIWVRRKDLSGCKLRMAYINSLLI